MAGKVMVFLCVDRGSDCKRIICSSPAKLAGISFPLFSVHPKFCFCIGLQMYHSRLDDLTLELLEKIHDFLSKFLPFCKAFHSTNSLFLGVGNIQKGQIFRIMTMTRESIFVALSDTILLSMSSFYRHPINLSRVFIFRRKTPFSIHGKLWASSVCSAMEETTVMEVSVLPPSSPQTFPPDTSPSDPRLYISALCSCADIFQIRQVHAQIAVGEMLGNLAVTNKLLHKYCHYKTLDDAHALFGRMVERDPYSWSVMIGGFSKVGDFTGCFETFRELLRSAALPDKFTLPFVIRACRDMVDLRFGKLIHCLTLKHGLVSDRFVCAAFVDMYARCDAIEDARYLFDKMPSRDLVTWTVMIGSLAERGNANESLILFDRMRAEGFVPDKVAMVSIVYACAKAGLMHKAKQVHDYIDRMKFSLDVILGTALIDMYAKCGSIDSARGIFDKMATRNVVSWSAMIAAYGFHGQGRKALELFPSMLMDGIFPNQITFTSLLYACSHAGLTEEGLSIFREMEGVYSVKPDVKHYTCVVDLLGRAGRLEEAMNLIENMTVKKDEGLWSALLGACKIHRRLDLAEKAAKSLLEMQPRNPGHYVLLSNIYANAGLWKDVAKTRGLMTERRLKKIPGYTWIEIGDEVYKFGVGDKTHPKSKDIGKMLTRLGEKLELAGYIPDTNYVLHDIDEELKKGFLYTHSEKLAIAFGLISTSQSTPIRIIKNLRVCGDCHTFTKFVSVVEGRTIIVRDSNRFHHFENGVCSCGDYW